MIYLGKFVPYLLNIVSTNFVCLVVLTEKYIKVNVALGFFHHSADRNPHMSSSEIILMNTTNGFIVLNYFN